MQQHSLHREVRHKMNSRQALRGNKHTGLRQIAAAASACACYVRITLYQSTYTWCTAKQGRGVRPTALTTRKVRH